MNKKIIFGILGIFLFGIVVAAVGTQIRNTDVEFEKNVSDILIAEGIVDLEREHKVYPSRERAQVCFTGGYNLPCLKELDTFVINCLNESVVNNETVCYEEEKVNLTNEEIDIALDLQEKEYLEKLAGIFEQRKVVENVTVISEGTLTVKEKGLF